MPIDIPNLDDVSYQELIDELVRSIPNYSNQWTDFNASDPGITILELLSWVGQSLLYRANTISDQSYYNFLKLVVGDRASRPVDHYQTALLETLRQWPQLPEEGIDQYGNPCVSAAPRTAAEIAEIEAQTQAYWRVSNRAIAEQDYYALGLEAYYIERARLNGTTVDPALQFRQQSLEHLKQLRRLFVQVGTLSTPGDESDPTFVDLIVNVAPDFPLTGDNTAKQLDPQVKQLLQAVKNFVVPRRPVGTLIQVRQAKYTSIDLWVEVKLSSSVKQETVGKAVQHQIDDYVSSLHGGRSDDGWPFGEPLVSYDLIRIIGEVDGVDMVTNIALDGYVQVRSSEHRIFHSSVQQGQWIITQSTDNGKQKIWTVIQKAADTASRGSLTGGDAGGDTGGDTGGDSKAPETTTSASATPQKLTFDDIAIEELVGRVRVNLTSPLDSAFTQYLTQTGAVAEGKGHDG